MLSPVVELRDSQPFPQIALLELVDALYEMIALARRECGERDADVVCGAEVCFDGGGAADCSFGLQCTDMRQIGYPYNDRRILEQRILVNEAESAAADIDEVHLMEIFETAVIARELYLDGVRDRDADEIPQLNPFGTLRDVKIPDRVGQLGGCMIGNDKVVDAACACEVTMKNMTGRGGYR